MRYILLLLLGTSFGTSRLHAEHDIPQAATVYDDAIITFLLEITPERFPDDFTDMKTHGADQCHSIVTVAVAQAFAIFYLRDRFQIDKGVNRAYLISISRLLAHYDETQIRAIIERGFGTDKHDPDTFRFGQQYLAGHDTKDLPQALDAFVKIKSNNKKKSNKSEQATPRKPSD